MNGAWIVGAALSLVIGATACDKPSKEGAGNSLQTEAPAPSPNPTVQVVCTRQPMAEMIDLAEASGATFLDDTTLLLVGDSGTKGAFVLVDPSNGELKQKGKLALDADASDDLEGVSRMDGRIYAITSSGWMREWSRGEDGIELTRSSYPLAPSAEGGLVCASAHRTNCAKNYEGLCLLPAAPPVGQCAGFAAAKASGELICLTADASGKLALDPARIIAVAQARSLSGCDFDDQGRLWFGNNFFAASAIGYVENWQSPAQAKITEVGSIGLGFPEAIALGKEGLMIRASDTSGSPSLLSKYICR